MKANEQQASEALWRQIDASPFKSMYVMETYYLARKASRALTELVEKAGRPQAEGTDFIKVDSDWHYSLTSTLAMVARLRSFLHRRKRYRANQTQQLALDRRSEALRGLLSAIDLRPVLDSAVRNSLEHFDEYLDDTAIASAEGRIPRPTLLPTDMILSRRSSLKRFPVRGQAPTIYPLRVYVCDEETLINAGKETHVGRLQQTCEAIANRLHPIVEGAEATESGAHILVITDKSFSPNQQIDTP